MKNAYVNLAISLFAFSEPLKPISTKVREGWTWNLWDKIEIPKGECLMEINSSDCTLKQLLQHLQSKYKLDASIISVGRSMIYSEFMAKDRKEERLSKKISEAVEIVTKTPVPAHQDYLKLEITVSRTEDGEEAGIQMLHRVTYINCTRLQSRYTASSCYLKEIINPIFKKKFCTLHVILLICYIVGTTL